MSISKQLREPVSKRLRFNVFKRDGFTCVYCGRKTPDVVLEIDHIVPVSKGGNSAIENLSTACMDCNRGKSDKSLTVIPKSLKARAERIKESERQLSEYSKIVQNQVDRIEEDCWSIFHVLYGSDCNSVRKSYLNGVRRIIQKMQPADALMFAVATIKSLPWHSTPNSKFKYFAKCCWNHIKGVQS